jgi:hypothetical protein
MNKMLIVMTTCIYKFFKAPAADRDIFLRSAHKTAGVLNAMPYFTPPSLSF